MIATVTPNPSIDRTVSVDRLERGGLHRASSVRMEAAGKGLNVSGALRRHGIDTLAVFPLASATAELYLGLLDGALPTLTVPVPGSVRVNLTLLEPDGTVTKVNEPGPALSGADATALLDAAADVSADWLVGCGSLPPAPGRTSTRGSRASAPTGVASRSTAAARPWSSRSRRGRTC